MTNKRVLCPERLRQLPAQFSWVDQRLVRDRHLARCEPPAAALYLFLVTVADAQGLSYYAEATLGRCLSLSAAGLCQARADLVMVGLIAYQRPLYQVLALPAPVAIASRARDTDDISHRLGQLRASLGQTP